jgi:hypothetical protein
MTPVHLTDFVEVVFEVSPAFCVTVSFHVSFVVSIVKVCFPVNTGLLRAQRPSVALPLALDPPPCICVSLVAVTPQMWCNAVDSASNILTDLFNDCDR